MKKLITLGLGSLITFAFAVAFIQPVAVQAQVATTTSPQIVISLDPVSPVTSTVQISPSAQTVNIPLAVFDVKSQGGVSAIQSLAIRFDAFNVDISTPLSSLFSNISIKVGGQIYSGTDTGGRVEAFNNLNIPLPANTTVPITLYVSTTASSTLNGANITAILNSSTTYVHAIDTNGVVVPVTGGNIYGNTITFAYSVVPTLSASLDAVSPITSTLSTPQSNITFAVIDLTAGSNPLSNMNGIQVGSDSLNAPSLSNIKVYDGTTLLGTAPSLVNNGSYYYQWINVSNVNIPANTTKQLRITADVTSSLLSTSTSIRLGITGLNFNSPGASVTGLPVYGMGMYFMPAGSTVNCPVGFTCVSTSTPGVQVSNATATLGNPTVGTNGVISSYPVSFSYTLTAGNQPIYESDNFVSALRFISSGLAGYPPLTNVVANPNFLAGDNNVPTIEGYYIIPAGTSRTFTWSGLISSSIATSNGTQSLGVSGIYYGTTPTNMVGNSIVVPLLVPVQVILSFGNSSTQPSITVISPNGGEVWNQNIQQTISWKSTGLSNTDTITISFVGSDGAVCVNGTTPASNTTFWIIPSSAGCSNNPVLNLRNGGRYKVLLTAGGTDIGKDAASDYSDNYFTISSGSPSPCYTFSTNLGIGSTGADVTALQSWLIAHGFSIPDITSGTANPGYFGSSTAIALGLYQTSVGIPSTGFFGPLTRASINSVSCTPTQPPCSTSSADYSTCHKPVIHLTSTPISSTNAYGVNYRVTFDGTKFDPADMTLEFSCSSQFVSWTTLGGEKSNQCTNRPDYNTGMDMMRFGDGDWRLTVYFTNSSSVPQLVGTVAKMWGGVDGKTLITTDKDAMTLPPNINSRTCSTSSADYSRCPQQQVTLSNTSAVKGPLVTDSTGTNQSQNVTFGFTLTAGNNPIYLSTALTDTSALTPNSSLVFAAKGFIVPAKGSLNSFAFAGDTASYFMIPPGSSRQFTFTGMLSSAMNAVNGVNIVEIVGINYGTSPTNLSAYQINSSLLPMKIVSDITIGSVATVACPVGYICSVPGNTTPVCSVGYTCTNVTANCPSGYICMTESPTTTATTTIPAQPQQAPVVNSISPTTATPLTSINIYGSGFYSMYTSIGINGPSSFPSDSPNSISSDGTQMSVILPSSILPGQYTITASNLVNGKWVQSSGSATLTVNSTPITPTLPPTISHSCPTGQILDSTQSQCWSGPVTYTCPSSYTLSGQICSHTTIDTVGVPATRIGSSSASYYSCPSGYTLSVANNRCYAASTTTTGPATTSHGTLIGPSTKNYSCPSGYTFNGSDTLCHQNITEVLNSSTSNTANVWDSFVNWFTSLF